MNYAEQYPQCAACPRLQEWQAARDEMTSRFETAVLKTRLDVVEEEAGIEARRVEIDEKYADLLGAVDDHFLPPDHPHVVEQMFYYNALDSILGDSISKKEADCNLAESIFPTLVKIQDAEVRQFTSVCKRGPRVFSFLGFTSIRCRSIW